MKSFLGMPMQWDWKNLHKDIWNPKDKRVFPPKHFGIGWGFNVHALLSKSGVIKKNSRSKSARSR